LMVRTLSIFAAVFGVLMFTAGTAGAAAGMLDPTFGTGGRVSTSIGTMAAYGYCMSVQPDGKILVGGTTGDGSWDFALARYNSNGTLDLTFDNDGKVTTNFVGLDVAAAIAVQPDGKIILAGETGSLMGPSDIAVARSTLHLTVTAG
jgi:uncharacterized delta-60 repeat protein